MRHILIAVSLALALGGCAAAASEDDGGPPDRGSGERPIATPNDATTIDDGAAFDDAGGSTPDTADDARGDGTASDVETADLPLADSSPRDGDAGQTDIGELDRDLAPQDSDAGDAAEESGLDGTTDPPTSFCGDETCDLTETPRSCPDDCGRLDLPRGLSFVREEPLFISGLTVAMPQPPAAIVNEYFDAFHATAVHTWEDGVPTQVDGWRAAGRSDFRFVSWVRADGTSHDGGAIIGGYPADAPGRIGYQVGDEPTTMADLADIEVGIGAVRRADPNALIIVNFFQTDELEAMLARTSELDVDVYSYDRYTFRSRGMLQTANIIRRAGLADDRPYWCYLTSYAGSPDDDIPTISDMRWQAFAHMTLGFTGYSWFLYQVAPPHSDVLTTMLFDRDADWGAERNDVWSRAAQVNLEVANVGRVVSQLTSTDIRYIPGIPLRLPDGVDGWSRGAGGDPYISAIEPQAGMLFTTDLLVGFFTDDTGERYVMMQNQAHENNEFPSGHTDPLTTHVEFDFAGATGVDTSELLALVPATGAIESLRLTSLGGSRARLVTTIGAGEVLLFKYATGRPFATSD